MIRIESFEDERLWPYRNLKDRQLAQQGDLFIAEGEHVTRRLLASGTHQTVSVLAIENKAAAVRDAVPDDVPLYVASAEVVSRVIGFDFHRGMLAVGRRPVSATVERTMQRIMKDKPCGPATILACEQVLNDENLGSIMRIAAGFGVDALLLGPRSCDPYWRRSIRVSMGSVFTLPVIRSRHLWTDLEALRANWNASLVASVVDEDATPLHASCREKMRGDGRVVVILMGSESQGLSPWTISHCDHRVTIPMSYETDSLNIAMATAVFLYHYTQASFHKTPPVS